MIHMLIGIQGSGKTTFALELKKKLHCEIASTDYVRANMKHIPESEVFPTVYKMCSEALKNDVDIIYDATNITPKVRQRFFDAMVSLGAIPKVGAYYFDTDVNVCYERVKIRNTKEGELYLPEEVVFSYHSKIVKPSLDEKFSFIKIVKNGQVVEEIVNEKEYIN